MAVKLVDVRTHQTEVDVAYGIPVVDVLQLGYLGQQGPQGIQGVPGDPAVAVLKECAIPLAISRVVKFIPGNLATYANADEIGDRRISIALTKQAGGVGDTIEVITQGEWTEATWSWTVGESVYLALDGNLTQTVPTSPTYAFVRVCGVATDTDTIYFKPEPPVVLA